MLRKYLHNYQIEQLPVPMNSITADLISGKVVVRDQGDAVDGIIESINLPLLALPVMRNGQALVDGGVINNVPADVLVAKGCNFVIAVNVSAKMKLEFSGNRTDTQSHKTKPPSTLQTLVRTYVVQSASSDGAESADVVIEPDLTKYKLTDFVLTAEMAKVGEETTREAIPKIKELLAKLDNRLFANQSV
jgi:NTE family protein